MAHVIYRHLWLSATIGSLCVIAEKDTSNRDTSARSFTPTVRLKPSESSDGNLGADIVIMKEIREDREIIIDVAGFSCHESDATR
jgi:hypothetical protein